MKNHYNPHSQKLKTKTASEPIHRSYNCSPQKQLRGELELHEVNHLAYIILNPAGNTYLSKEKSATNQTKQFWHSHLEKAIKFSTFKTAFNLAAELAEDQNINLHVCELTRTAISIQIESKGLLLFNLKCF